MARRTCARRGNVPAAPSDDLIQLANIFGLPVEALVRIIEQDQRAIKKPFYTIPDLAQRWNCSRATVYNILRDSGFKLFKMSREGRRKGKWLVPAAVVEHIEQSRMEAMHESLSLDAPSANVLHCDT